MYALASGLIGFPHSMLRVRVERVAPGYVWVRTADICDAGTPLVIAPEQVAPMSPRDGWTVADHPRALPVLS